MAYLPTPNQSVSGTVGASIIGLAPVSVSNFPTNQNVSGSVVAFQGTSPWVVAPNNSSMITVSSGSVATVIIGGSIAASFTPPANQSVSGTVGASVIGLTPVAITNTPSISGTVNIGNLPTTQNVSGSVVATQGTTPWIVTSNTNSVITVSQSSVAVAIISGSIAATFTPPANQSVSGTVGASVIGLTPVSVSNFPTTQNVSGSVVSFPQGTIVTSLVSTIPSSVIVGSSIFGQLPGGTAVLGSIATLQGTNPWIITGSVQGSFTAPANQSVSGEVSVSNFPANQSVSGAISVSNFPTTQNVSGSVVAWLTSTNASVITVGTAAANQSVSGTVNVGNFPTTQNVSGSVVAFQGAGWSGSVVAFPTGNQSVSGTVGASVIGIAPVTLTANTMPASALAFLGATTSITAANTSVITVTGYPQATLQITSNPSMTGTILFEGSADNSSWVPITGYNQATNALASVTTSADANWAFNTAGLQTFRARLSAWTAGSVTGKVYLSPSDARPFSQYIVGNPSISGQIGASIIGQLPAGTAPIGSVAALQGTLPWAIAGSVAATITNTNVNVSGSVAAFVVGSSSIITTWKDSSVLSVPVGSTLVIWQSPSIVGTYAEDAASATADKGIFTLGVRNDAVASLASADLDYIASARDSAGRTVVKPFSPEDGTIISYTGSVVSGSVTLIQASVIGKRSYITDFWVANTGSVATLITFQGGDTSIVGYTIAPAGGGSNSPGIAIPLKTTLSQDLAFKSGTSSSILYMTVKGYQAP